MSISGSQIRIAIDAMGGDNAPFSIVAGAVQGYRVLHPKVKLILVGDAQRIGQELEGLKAEKMPIEVVDAPENIDMRDNPIEAVRQKKSSSINVGLSLQKQDRADAFISAGNTGAVMASSLLTTKGNELTIASHKMLDSSSLNFCGNVEGRDILKGAADVVVCDGFVGNIVLKFAESTGSFMTTRLKQKIRGNLFATLGAFLMKAAFRNFRQSLDSADYGGAPLLGINGVCIICHGNSSPRAIKNAILVAIDMVRKQVNNVIQEKINANGQSEISTVSRLNDLMK